MSSLPRLFDLILEYFIFFYFYHGEFKIKAKIKDVHCSIFQLMRKPWKSWNWNPPVNGVDVDSMRKRSLVSGK